MLITFLSLIGFSTAVLAYLVSQFLTQFAAATSEWPEWKRSHRLGSSRLPYPSLVLFLAAHIRPSCIRWSKPDPSLRDRSELQGWVFWDEAFERALQVLLCAISASIGAGVALLLALDIPLSLLLVVCSGMAGWFDPPARLKARHRRSKEACLEGMPGLLDGLVIALEAGQSLSRSMEVSLSRGFRDGDEAWIAAMRQTLEDMKRGLGAEPSLSRLRRLLPVPVVHRFSSTCVLGETQGQSISAVLRRQAEQCRREAQMVIEKRALEAPVKLMAPLMICIFPCTFIVLLAPLSQAVMSVGGA